MLVGVSSVLSALMQPLAASVAERSRRLALRQWSALLALVMAAGAVLLLVLPGKGGQAACYMLLLVVLQILTPFTYSLGMECVNRNVPLNYGVARSAGSIAYAGASSLCGMLAKSRGAGALPLAVAVMLMVLTTSLITENEAQYVAPFDSGGARRPRGKAPRRQRPPPGTARPS